MKIQDKQIFLLTGDSVTDCGRAYPVGEGSGNLGDGYVRDVHALLDSGYPEKQIRVLNTGISGNTSTDLRGRFQQDVLEHQPDWISIMIGINDIWRQFDRPLHPKEHVLLQEYADNLEWMTKKAMEKAAGVCLVSPCYMEQIKEDGMRKMTDDYNGTLREIAQKCGALYIDAQAEMDRYFRVYPPVSMSWDRVHPNHVGHMLIAKAIVRALDYEF